MSVYICTCRSISTVGQFPSVKMVVGQHCIGQSAPYPLYFESLKKFIGLAQDPKNFDHLKELVDGQKKIIQNIEKSIRI